MILVGDVRDKLKEMPEKSVHCVVTSPPYWGLRDYGVDGQLGLEPTMQEYISKMVEVFREVRRVMRDDAVLFLNLGDKYNGSNKGYGQNRNNLYIGISSKQLRNVGSFVTPMPSQPGLKPKDLCGVPWRIALALQDDGWWLRSDIIWAKPNPMPESVTDRPTKAHEYIFLLTKSSKYFWDQEAVREKNSQGAVDRFGKNPSIAVHNRKYEGMDDESLAAMGSRLPIWKGNDRNLRTVWTIPTHSFSGAHFATFPPKLVEICINAGTSEWGCCPECGKAWVRVVEKKFIQEGPRRNRGRNKSGDKDAKSMTMGDKGLVGHNDVTTIGFRPSCSCTEAAPLPCTVLDPFMGAGTVGLVAQAMNRKWIGIELNPVYADMAKKRIGTMNIFADGL